MRLFIGILVGILVLFQYDLWFGKNGYFDYKDVEAQIKENKAENEKLSQRNQMISAEILRSLPVSTRWYLARPIPSRER